MSNATIFENARIVLADDVIHGWVAVQDGRIVETGAGKAPEKGEDLAGDYLLPGLVELHTDHLESHYSPRPGVKWNRMGAVMAYDAQISASGITTVFDSLRAGSDVDGGGFGPELMALGEALQQARDAGLLRCDHLTHLRCEIPSVDVLEAVHAFAARFPVGLMSLMDHTPGQRQFRDIDKYLQYYCGKSGKSLEAVRGEISHKQAVSADVVPANRQALAALARRLGTPIASHDDTTLDDVSQSVAEGVALAEFPTTMEAAEACRDHGVTVMMGAPNLVRGGSHSGNIAAADLARAGLLDIFSSDYVPASLLMAAFHLPEAAPDITLPQAIATVTRNPARATGLDDRGEIRAGLRADLARVAMMGETPVVRQVWRGGQRVS
ncbi:alpha-D-ribose 1-methylphosphonate 5-triphosphate diphosphatase [Camelimonas sp. ID_303_24]